MEVKLMVTVVADDGTPPVVTSAEAVTDKGDVLETEVLGCMLRATQRGDTDA
jgi:hypothetical protein